MAILRSPWTALAGPAEAHGVRSADEYRLWHARYLAENRRPASWASTEDVAAYVSDGRWVTDCPHCGNGPSVDPDARLACCGECGAVFARVQIPAQRVRIEALLVQRPRRINQHWQPGESITTLAEENRQRGVKAE